MGKFEKIFSLEQEKELVDYLLDLEVRLHGLTIREMRIFVYQIAEKHTVKHSFTNCMAGVDWMSNFLRRNPILKPIKQVRTSLHVGHVMDITQREMAIKNENIYRQSSGK